MHSKSPRSVRELKRARDCLQSVVNIIVCGWQMCLHVDPSLCSTHTPHQPVSAQIASASDGSNSFCVSVKHCVSPLNPQRDDMDLFNMMSSEQKQKAIRTIIYIYIYLNNRVSFCKQIFTDLQYFVHLLNETETITSMNVKFLFSDHVYTWQV